MQKASVPENDPEFIKLRNFLAYAKQVQMKNQQRMMAEKQRQMESQQQQQQAEENGAAPHPSINGTNGTAPDTASTSQPPNGTTTAASTPSQTASALPATEKQGAQASSKHVQWTDLQKTLLRNQITAFRLLAKNMPLPTQVQQQLSMGSKLKSAVATPPVSASSEKAAVAPATGGATPAPASDTAVAPLKGLSRFKTYEDPWYSHRELSYSDHSLRSNHWPIPGITPFGVNLSPLIENRERIKYNRLEARRRELAEVYPNIAKWDTQKSEAQTEDHGLPLKLIIEYKKLNLLQRQRNLRQLIQREMVTANNLVMTANRSQYRRAKKQSIREARMAEKVERQQRDARETKERKKHDDFLTSIIRHHSEMKGAAHQHKQKVVKLGRMMLQQHQTLEKEEQRRIERTAKQRLQALRANDEETYLKLLGQAKDTRISHLLSQTDGFLKQLAASVKMQQRSAVERYRDRSMADSESESESEEEGGAARVDYYEVAHRNKEEVTQQSSNLVGGTLKEYQVKGLQWMISLYNNNLNGILADEMGLGKTIQTISLITYLIEKKKESGPYIVVVPLSTLTNWNNEFDKWAPSVVKIVYKGPPNQRKTLQNQIRWGQFQVLLTTYEFVIKDRPLLSKIKWLHMIVDEGHRMKNAKSKLSQTITDYYTTRYRLILTGTPLQNNLPELWALLNFVLPNIFKSVKSFDEWFNTPFANTGGQDKMELTEEEQLLVIRRLHKVLRPFLLRRLKKDVEKDLPDKQERVIKCNFSSLQAKLYKQLATNQRLMVGDGKGGRTGLRGLSNMLMQLRKLCNHPFVFEEVEDQVNPSRTSNDLLWRTAGKFELLDRVLPKFHATGHRVLMFFQMTQIMNIMEDFLRMRGITYLRLDGSTKADDRSELLRLFNAPNSPYFCFLLSTRAGGLGLNLQTADTVIIYDSDWNPHQDLQAQDRAHRIGQKNEVRILRLITSNSVEEKILERANYKLDMDGKVIQAGKFDNKSTNEEREAMLRVMLESAEAVEELQQEEMDDEDLNMMMMRSEEELVLFQKMDEDRLRDDKYGPGKRYPRLLSEEELPDIYLQDDDLPEPSDLIEETFGRGARERTRVRYDDGLTEEQWLEAVDNSDDNLEDAIARKDAKVQRRIANKEKKGNADEAEESARESSVSPVPKKRGRKPKAEKRKIEEVSEDVDTGPRKRGRQSLGLKKSTETLSPEVRKKLQKVLSNVVDTLMDLEEESNEEDVPNRDIIGIFIELPDRQDYPDYYVIIKDPICMNQIEKKISKKEYQNIRTFLKDIRLLCDNCRTYNEDGSVLYRDANLIEVCSEGFVAMSMCELV
jgi:ATP-dependent helicase STH1/SNF2